MADSPHFPSVSRARLPLLSAAAILNVDILTLPITSYTCPPSAAGAGDGYAEESPGVSSGPQVLPVPVPGPSRHMYTLHAMLWLYNLTLLQNDEDDSACAV